MRPELSCKLGELPDLPGIYIFTSDAGEALYVGKAKSLRRRAAAYRKPAEDPRIALMLHDAADVEFVVTDSEAEALLFENNWIKRRQPRFNIRLRDDKTYPYLKLTLADGHPRLAFTRRIRRDGAEYYGPYLPAGLARKAIKLTQKLFGIRVCRIDIDGSLPRPCLYHDMKRCLGPCVDGLTTDEAYADAVEKARLFLAGRNEELLKDLRTRMRTLADELEFEAAARLRDTIHEIDEVSQRRKLSSARGEDVDIFGVHTSGDNAAVTVLVMRGGQVLDRRELFWEGVPRITAERLLSELLPQLYDRTTLIPKEIHLPVPIEGEEALIEWLSSRRESRVYLRLPSRGPKAQRIALANRNAAMAFRRRFRGAGAGGEAGAALRKALDLADPPRRIEGFDISTFGGSQTVASLVVWNDGRMVKGQYRSFNIRGLSQADDFASIHQAVSRRYRRVLDEVGEMPDLILIDGGRGQLNAALEALVELGVDETPVVGLAKREEELYLPARPAPLRLKRSHAGLRVLQEVRDEAHRFAVSRHRRRRSRRSLHSRFDDLRGIGPQRRKLLVRRFGSFAGVAQASEQQLSDVLGPKLARSVYASVHGERSRSGQ